MALALQGIRLAQNTIDFLPQEVKSVRGLQERRLEVAAMVAMLLAAGGLALVFFIKVEAVSRRPLLPLHLLSRRYFNAAVASAVFSFMILFVVIMLTPFYLHRVLALSSSRIGLVMMSIPLAGMRRS